MWYDENGIYYIGLEDFCLNCIEELDSTLCENSQDFFK